MQNQFLDPYIPLAALFGISLLLPIVMVILSVSLGPRRPEARKAMPYESGMTPIGAGQRRLPVRFYRIAVLFILFDVDIILLVPYTLVLRELGLFGLNAVLIFVVVFILGALWVWKKGVLEWE
jgi:NADH-quinone oxidoreductase subunit A